MQSATDIILFIGIGSAEQARILAAFRAQAPEFMLKFLQTSDTWADSLLKDGVRAVFIMHDPPAVNGLAVLADMKSKRIKVPAVIVLKAGDEGLILEALREGTYDCVTGDASLPTILRRVLARFEMHRERAELERIMSESQKEWVALFDGITDYIFMADEQQRIVRANRALAAAFGKHPRDILGLHCHELFGLSVTEGKCFEMENCRQGTEEKTLNGETYMISSFPLEYDNQQWTIYILKNITEMKRLKEQLYHADKLASVGLLTAGVAHEINNPLTGIVAYTELLMMKGTDEDTRKDLQKIFDSAERCAKIVENLLTFSRQRTPSNSIESINNIIDRTVDLRAYWLRSSNIEIVREYEQTPTVYIDSQQIQQVMLNVLLNAEQAINSTGNRNGRIVFATRHDPENQKIIIRVTDNGPGIPQDMISKIFDPFFTTKSVGVGTGLGLSISHGIITEHGGTIRAENADGGGATFIIELPTKAGVGLVAADFGASQPPSRFR